MRVDLMRDRQIGIDLKRAPHRRLRERVIGRRIAAVLPDQQVHAREPRPRRRVMRIFFDRPLIQIARDHPRRRRFALLRRAKVILMRKRRGWNVPPNRRRRLFRARQLKRVDDALRQRVLQIEDARHRRLR